jgi:hypothetical protein
VLTIRPRHTIDKNLLSDGRESQQLAHQVGAHCVSRRSSPVDWIEGHRVSLTLGATLHFSSLGSVYTGMVESVAGHTFARPPRPNILMGRRDARSSSEASRMRRSGPCWAQTQRMIYPIWKQRPRSIPSSSQTKHTGQTKSTMVVLQKEPAILNIT